MREMYPVIARGVIPASMNIYDFALFSGKRQMAIGLIEEPARPLSFEVKTTFESVSRSRTFSSISNAQELIAALFD